MTLQFFCLSTNYEYRIDFFLFKETSDYDKILEKSLHVCELFWELIISDQKANVSLIFDCLWSLRDNGKWFSIFVEWISFVEFVWGLGWIFTYILNDSPAGKLTHQLIPHLTVYQSRHHWLRVSSLDHCIEISGLCGVFDERKSQGHDTDTFDSNFHYVILKNANISIRQTKFPHQFSKKKNPRLCNQIHIFHNYIHKNILKYLCSERKTYLATSKQIM